MLEPLTPLGHFEPLTETLGPLTLREVVDTALASLATRRGREADVAAAAASLGLPLPSPGRAASGPTFAAFWLGPDQWMVEAPFATHEDISAHLRAAFEGAASITEQTDAWVRFDLAAPDLAPLFERLCALDTPAMEPGHATRTVIEHLGCYVICRTLGLFTILGPRSAARSLHHALTTAARSVW